MKTLIKFLAGSQSCRLVLNSEAPVIGRQYHDDGTNRRATPPAFNIEVSAKDALGADSWRPMSNPPTIELLLARALQRFTTCDYPLQGTFPTWVTAENLPRMTGRAQEAIMIIDIGAVS